VSLPDEPPEKRALERAHAMRRYKNPREQHLTIAFEL